MSLTKATYSMIQGAMVNALDFMTEAEKLGYIIPFSFRQKWISYQKKTAQEWRFDNRYKYSANDQAYRLFTLALAGQPEKGAMNRLRETEGLPQLSSCHILPRIGKSRIRI
jgi:hypothetical protein